MARTTAPTNRMRAMTPATDTTMMTRVLTPPLSGGRERLKDQEGWGGRWRGSERGEGEGREGEGGEENCYVCWYYMML